MLGITALSIYANYKPMYNHILINYTTIMQDHTFSYLYIPCIRKDQDHTPIVLIYLLDKTKPCTNLPTPYLIRPYSYSCTNLPIPYLILLY